MNSRQDSGHLNSVNQSEKENKRFSSQKNIVDTLFHLMKQQSPLDLDLDVFDGNPLYFYYFMTHCIEVVEKEIDDTRGKLTRLLKYTRGHAKEIINYCVQDSSTMIYQHTKKMLVEIYGNPYHSMVEYRKEIKAWSIIRTGDVEGYQRFYNFLLKCESITQSVQWNQLDTLDVIYKLQGKLPSYYTGKWVKHVLRIQGRQLRQPDFEDFIEFLKDEKLLVNDFYFEIQQLISIVRDHQKAHIKILIIKETS